MKASAHLSQFRAACWLGCLAALVLFEWSARGQAFRRVQANDDWTRHFRIGGLVGLNIKADFNKYGTFKVSGGVLPGVYDDGYVRVDNTGNEGGFTTYWGYDNLPGQRNSAANTLAMHRTTSSTGATSFEKNGSPFAGFDMAYGDNLFYWKRARIGWEFGFGLLPISIAGSQTTQGTASQTEYLFDTTGVVLPPGPYYGPPNGSGTVSIPGTPFATNYSAAAPATIVHQPTLDVMLYALRLGPSVYWDVSRYVGVSAGAGPALGIVSGKVQYTDSVVVNGVTTYTEGRILGTEVVYGGYVNASVMVHVVENGDVYVGAQYMPLGTATISGNGQQGRLKLGGAVYISAGINWPF